MENLIIAATMSQGSDVASHIVTWGSDSEYARDRRAWRRWTPESCPPVPQIPIRELHWSVADQASRDLQGWVPDRIIIVDYPRWVTRRAGTITNLWQNILFAKHAGAAVVWW